MTAAASLAGGLVIGVGPDLVASGPDDPGLTRRLAIVISALVVGAVTLGLGARLRARRRLLWDGRGTLYVLESPMSHWKKDDIDAYLDRQRAEFAEALVVPGPTDLYSWAWPIDHAAPGWSDAVDDLVLSFLSVEANDSRSTPNSVVIRAAWPVALLWAARVRTSRRDLVLSIRQRASTGRVLMTVDTWQREGHAFLGPPKPMAGASDPLVVEHAGVTLTFRRGDGRRATGDFGAVRILLVRTSTAAWSSVVEIPGDLDEAKATADLRPKGSGNTVALTVDVPDAAPWVGSGPVELFEWRCLPKDGRVHDWADFPAMAEQITRWIASNALSPDSGVTFVGTTIPQEVSTGVGIIAEGLDPNQWPAHLWPLVMGTNGLVSPDLDLGYASLHAVRAGAPRGMTP